MTKYTLQDLEQILSSDCDNDIMINFSDLIVLINLGELVLSTKSGKRCTINNHPDVKIPSGVCFVDSGNFNYGENTFEVVLIGEPIFNFSKITFIGRANEYFDAGSVAILESIPEHNYPSGYFRGFRDECECGDECSLFEFDWIDDYGNNLRSNIPDIKNMSILKDWIVKDNDTGVMYNWLENKIVN